GLAEQLLDVGRARAVGLFDVPREVHPRERETARIEVEQSRATSRVRDRQLRHEIDASGPSGERGLEDVGPVRREDEQNVRVVRETVQLVQEIEQDRTRLLGVQAPLLRDEIDALAPA